jgi:MFS family permease
VGRHLRKNEQNRSLHRNGPFGRLWAAQFASMTVVYGLSLAGAVLVEQRTHSVGQTGLVIISAILPSFLASLVAGAVVDRWGQVPVLVASHSARTLLALAFWLGTQFLPTGPAVTLVYAVNVAGAIFSQFALTSELALLPDLVDSAQLVSANALFQFGTLAAEGLGIVVLGPLAIKLAGAPAMGLIGAALYLVALMLAATLPQIRSTVRKTEEEKGALSRLGADLQAGWQTIITDRLLSLVALQATLAATLLLVLLSLVPGLVSRHLGLGVEDAPFLILPGGLGFALGSYLVGRWAGWLRGPVWIAVGLTALGGSLGLLAMVSSGADSLWLMLPLILGVGVALALVIVPARTVLQERPPAPLRGRVIAAQLALANAAAIVPLLLGGALADQVGIRPVMGLLSLLAVGAGAVGLHQARS